MKQLLFLTTLAISPAALGQCPLNMLINAVPQCDGVHVYVAFTGTQPTPPYQVNMMVGPNQVLDMGFDATGYTYVQAWNGTTSFGNVDVAVYDALGCQGTMSWTGNLSRVESTAEWSTEVNCTTGLWTLRWTNANDACGNVGDHYIAFPPYGGTVSNMCTQESATTWRWTAPLSPPGSNAAIDWINGLGPVTFNCPNGSVQCWSPTQQLITLPYVQPGDCGVNVILKAALLGPMQSNGNMSMAMRTAGLVPLTEPYTALGYGYVGSPSLAPVPSFYMTSFNIVDWVVIELRNASNPSVLVFSRPAFIRDNGSIVDIAYYIQGTGWFDPNINFPVPAGNYHIAIRHRNHLGIMTASPVALADEPSTVDFRVATTPTFGTNARVQVGNVWCLWSGDVTFNGVVKYVGANNDRDPILAAIGSIPTAMLTGQYRAEDVNLDGVVKYVGANNDRDPILQNIGGTTPTNTRTQQLP